MEIYLLRFVPVPAASPVLKGHIRGSVFLRGMPKALTVKKFSHRLSSLFPKGKSPLHDLDYLITN